MGRGISGKMSKLVSSGLRSSGRLDGRSVLESVRSASSGGASVEGAHVSRADQSEGDTCAQLGYDHRVRFLPFRS